MRAFTYLSFFSLAILIQLELRTAHAQEHKLKVVYLYVDTVGVQSQVITAGFSYFKYFEVNVKCIPVEPDFPYFRIFENEISALDKQEIHHIHFIKPERLIYYLKRYGQAFNKHLQLYIVEKNRFGHYILNKIYLVKQHGISY